MKIFSCSKCGSTDVFIDKFGNNIGLYCGDCGKWIKWLNKDEFRLVKRQIENQEKKTKMVKYRITNPSDVEEYSVEVEISDETYKFFEMLQLEFGSCMLEDLLIEKVTD